MTTTDTRTFRPSPDTWKPGLTRVLHNDGQHGTYVRNSRTLPGPRSVLVRFDGETDLVDVDPVDLAVTALRDPFATIAGRLPTRYAPGDTALPYDYPEGAYDHARGVQWHPVVYYFAGEVVDGEGQIWLVEPYPAARADRSDGLDPVDSAGVAVLRGAAGPRPRIPGQPDGDWIIPGSGLSADCAYDVHVDNQRDLLAAWCEAWAIAAALNTGAAAGFGVEPQDVEVLLAAERRELIGDSRYAGTGDELQWSQIHDAVAGAQRVPAASAARLRSEFGALITACTVTDRYASHYTTRPSVRKVQHKQWQETLYMLTQAGTEALAAIRQAGADCGGPYCRVCGCSEWRPCPDGCAWRPTRQPAQLVCTACQVPSARKYPGRG